MQHNLNRKPSNCAKDVIISRRGKEVSKCNIITGDTYVLKFSTIEEAKREFSRLTNKTI